MHSKLEMSSKQDKELYKMGLKALYPLALRPLKEIPRNVCTEMVPTVAWLPCHSELSATLSTHSGRAHKGPKPLLPPSPLSLLSPFSERKEAMQQVVPKITWSLREVGRGYRPR